MIKAFCPNCGTENEGTAGNRIACIACTATFEVPRDGSWVGGQQTQPSAAPRPVAPPPLSRPAPSYIGPPPSGFGQGSGVMGAGGGYNKLAIASLVLGILCCLPFSGIAAIVTGVIAQQQIARSGERGRELAIAGIVIGSLALAVTLISVLTNLLARH